MVWIQRTAAGEEEEMDSCPVLGIQGSLDPPLPWMRGRESGPGGGGGTSEDGRSLRFQDWTRPPGGREGRRQGGESRAECGGSWEAEQRRGSLRAERGLRERRVSGGVSLAQRAAGPGARDQALGCRS